MDVMKPFEVVVPSVKDVERVLFIRDLVHRLRVMRLGWCNPKERRDIGLNIIQRMHLDSSFGFSEKRPFKSAQAQIYRGGVERVHLASKLEDFGSTASLGFRYNTVSELLEDAVVSTLVGFGKIALRGCFTKPQMVCFRGVSLCGKYNIPEAFAVGKLAKHQNGQLVPASEVLDIPVSFVSI